MKYHEDLVMELILMDASPLPCPTFLIHRTCPLVQ